MRTRLMLAWLGLLLCAPTHALGSERRHGFDVTLDATAGYILYQVRRTQQYAEGNRFARLDVDTQEHSTMFGGDARVGYKLVFSPRVALTPLIDLNYSRGRTQTRYYDTKTFSYAWQATPAVFSMLLGAEVLLRDELIGLRMAVGGGTLKLDSGQTAQGGPALLFAGRLRLPLDGAFSASLGLGAELLRLSPLGLSPAGPPEQAVRGFLQIGIEFDGCYERRPS